MALAPSTARKKVVTSAEGASPADILTGGAAVGAVAASPTLGSIGSVDKLKRVGDWIFGETLGQGSFGKVKLAHHHKTKEKVAIKIVDKSGIANVEDVERVYRETFILTTLKHSNIIKLFEVLDTPKSIMLVMEYAGGGELFSYVSSKHRLGELESCRLFQQIIQGVEYCHRCLLVGTEILLADGTSLAVENVKKDQELLGDGRNVRATADALIVQAASYYQIQTLDQDNYSVSPGHHLTLVCNRGPKSCLIKAAGAHKTDCMQVSWWMFDATGDGIVFKLKSWPLHATDPDSSAAAASSTGTDNEDDEDVDLLFDVATSTKQSTLRASWRDEATSKLPLIMSKAEAKDYARAWIKTNAVEQCMIEYGQHIDVTADWLSDHWNLDTLRMSDTHDQVLSSLRSTAVPLTQLASQPADESDLSAVINEAMKIASWSEDVHTSYVLLSNGKDEQTGRGRYVQLVKGAQAEVAYMLHNPLVANGDSGQKAAVKQCFTFQQLDRAHTLINVNPGFDKGLVITELNPIASQTGGMNSSSSLSDQVDFASIKATLDLGVTRVVAFGGYAVDLWRNDACKVPGIGNFEMLVKNGIETFVMTYDAPSEDGVSMATPREIIVFCCPHPCSWFKFRVVARAIALAWRVNESDLPALDHQLRNETNPERAVLLGIKHVNESCSVVRLEVAEGEPESTKRYVIRGGLLTHNCRVIHRDLKLENILLDKMGMVKIADFGLSNSIKFGQKMDTSCGTPSYTCPEQIMGKKYVGNSADIWSLGVILFAMISGFLPFEATGIPALFKKIKNRQYKCPDYISKEACDLIDRMLTIDPDKRSTIAELRNHPWMLMEYTDLADIIEAQKEVNPEMISEARSQCMAVGEDIASNSSSSSSAAAAAAVNARKGNNYTAQKTGSTGAPISAASGSSSLKLIPAGGASSASGLPIDPSSAANPNGSNPSASGTGVAGSPQNSEGAVVGRKQSHGDSDNPHSSNGAARVDGPSAIPMGNAMRPRERGPSASVGGSNSHGHGSKPGTAKGFRELRNGGTGGTAGNGHSSSSPSSSSAHHSNGNNPSSSAGAKGTGNRGGNMSLFDKLSVRTEYKGSDSMTGPSSAGVPQNSRYPRFSPNPSSAGGHHHDGPSASGAGSVKFPPIGGHGSPSHSPLPGVTGSRAGTASSAHRPSITIENSSTALNRTRRPSEFGGAGASIPSYMQPTENNQNHMLAAEREEREKQESEASTPGGGRTRGRSSVIHTSPAITASKGRDRLTDVFESDNNNNNSLAVPSKNGAVKTPRRDPGVGAHVPAYMLETNSSRQRGSIKPTDL